MQQPMRERGVVKWFDDCKGYGFITSDVGSKEVFFFRSDLETIQRSVEKGERVEFELGNGIKGVEAKHVISIQDQLEKEL